MINIEVVDLSVLICFWLAFCRWSALLIQIPLLEWTWPKWIPIIGGEKYLFFQYIFNIADTSISIGVLILIFFNKKIFNQNEKTESGVTA